MSRDLRPIGPLQFRRGYVSLGNEAGTHARLTADAISLRDGVEHVSLISWDSVSSIELEAPQTSFRWSGPALTLLGAVITLLSMQGPDFSPPDDGTLRFRGEELDFRFPMSSNQYGRYWTGDIENVQRFLRHLTSAPAGRSVLELSGPALRQRIARRQV